MRDLLSRLTSSELSEWQAFYRIEPFGEFRADLRAGTIASPLVNLQVKKGHRRTKPSDWIMEFIPDEPQSPEEMKRILQAFAQAAQKRAKRMARGPRRKRGRGKANG